MSHYELSGKRIWVTGHGGMVGSALLRALERRRDVAVLTASRAELDLRDQARVTQWVETEKPQVVLLVAAKNGGIQANRTSPADFLYENVIIESNVLHASYLAGVEKLLFVGSSTIYPRAAPQPICEEALLTGPLEPTHEGYGLAKIVGVKLCQAYRRQHGCDFISAISSNLYGPNDNFDLTTSSVLPALLRRFHDANESSADVVTLWGSGSPRREFVYVDDMADAILFLVRNYSDELHINVGAGYDVEIRELASVIRDVVGFKGQIEFDLSKPDGTLRKLMETSRINTLGWKPQTPLVDGIAATYKWFVENHARLRGMLRAD